jgi:hypothetical protein
MRAYGNLNSYIGLQRQIILKEHTGEMNISKSSNGGFHLFITPNTGFTYGYGLDALKQATEDFEYLQNKSIGERKMFVLTMENEKLKNELSF